MRRRRTVVMAGVFSIVGAMVALGEETKKKDEPVEAEGMEERVTVTATRLPAEGPSPVTPGRSGRSSAGIGAFKETIG